MYTIYLCLKWIRSLDLFLNEHIGYIYTVLYTIVGCPNYSIIWCDIFVHPQKFYPPREIWWAIQNWNKKILADGQKIFKIGKIPKFSKSWEIWLAVQKWNKIFLAIGQKIFQNWQNSPKNLKLGNLISVPEMY